jgi:tetratricopeptide (TPR) repeat protein
MRRTREEQRERQRRREEEFRELRSLSSEQLATRVQQAPSDAYLPVSWHEALQREGKPEEALAVLTAAIERLEPRRTHLVRRLRAYRQEQLGRHQEAIADYQALVALGFGERWMFITLGDLYRRLGDLSAARRQWREAIDFSPGGRPDPWWCDVLESFPVCLAQWRLLATRSRA